MGIVQAQRKGVFFPSSPGHNELFSWIELLKTALRTRGIQGRHGLVDALGYSRAALGK